MDGNGRSEGLVAKTLRLVVGGASRAFDGEGEGFVTNEVCQALGSQVPFN